MIRCDEVTKIFSKNGSEVTSLDRFTGRLARASLLRCEGQAVLAKPRCCSRLAACSGQAPVRCN